MTELAHHNRVFESLSSRIITIGLMGHSTGSDNLGVGALTVSHIAIIQHVCDSLGITPQFRLFSHPGEQSSYIEADNLITVSLRTRAFIAPRNGLYAAVRECDIVLDIAGGDSFADIYGQARFFRIALAKAVVLAAGRPLVFSPQTIGPFNRTWTKQVAVQLMRRARAVVSRDNLTSDFLRQLGLTSNIVDSTDVALRLPYVAASLGRPAKVRVGLNISGLLFNGGYTRDNMFGLTVDYPRLARDLVQTFAERPECEVHLVSHVISDHIEVEDDYRVSQTLARDYPQVIVAPRFKSPSEAKSYIAGMDFFSGSRMHACIAAFSSGVPVLPAAYSRKFAGVFEGLDYPHIADCQMESAEKVLSKVVNAFERRDELRAVVETSLVRAETKLAAYEALLRKCFLELVGRPG